ncbi:MAG: hypothetical protein PVF51_10405 [Nitrospirota bacterium]|jgi:hypothetical protein
MTTQSEYSYSVAREAIYVLIVGFLWGMALLVFSIGGIEGYKEIRNERAYNIQAETAADPAAQEAARQKAEEAFNHALQLWGEAGATIVVLCVGAVMTTRWMNRKYPA